MNLKNWWNKQLKFSRDKELFDARLKVAMLEIEQEERTKKGSRDKELFDARLKVAMLEIEQEERTKKGVRRC